MEVLVKMKGRWMELEVGSYTVQALVFDEPSEDYGIDGGRISKLWISNDNTGKCVYNYDRGLDFDNINNTDLKRIIHACEKVDQSKLTKGEQRVSV